MKIEIDYNKALDLTRKIIQLKKQDKFPFNKIIFPDTIIPKNIEKGSKEHLALIFYSTSLDSNQRSDLLYPKVINFAREIGGLENIAERSEPTLRRIILSSFGRNSHINYFETLKTNAEILKKKYNKNPKEIKGKTVKETTEKICKFFNYGPEKAALMIKNFVRFGAWDFPENEIPIKIDRHVQRINLGFGVIDKNKYAEEITRKGIAKKLQLTLINLKKRGYITQQDISENKSRIITAKKFTNALRETHLKITKEENISAIELDDAYWGIGSGLCNFNDTKYCYLYCPLKCEIRPPSDDNANWFFPYIDKRKNSYLVKHLFK